MSEKKMWGGRFTEKADPLAEQFNASIAVDQYLAEEDVTGSIAHASMLSQIGVLTKDEAGVIAEGLKEILTGLSEGSISLSMAMEDIHMNIESLLTDQVGEVAKKLHTARSRNDQVALDFRMYVKKENLALQEAVLALIETLAKQAKQHADALMPGYTHLQRAQPITLGFHLLAYVEMLKRDYDRLKDQYKRTDCMPLGSGALAGLPYENDRLYLKEALGFSEIALHAMDAVSDRDFAIEFLSTASMLQMHLSRLAEEIILWSSSEFQFIRLSDAYCTGSSIMPQKRNPDIAELIRGKTGKIYGNLMNLLTVLKALPLAYNKDLQEDKAPVIETAKELKMALTLMNRMLQSAKFNREKMAQAVEKGFLNATDLADYFVEKGVAFRLAHECAGTAVKLAENSQRSLQMLTLEEYQAIVDEVLGEKAPKVDEPLYQAIDLWQCVEKKKSMGSTALSEVKRMIELNEAWLSEQPAYHND